MDESVMGLAKAGGNLAVGEVIDVRDRCESEKDLSDEASSTLTR
jgi:hypothetical protein